jgi:hypothetical protein
MKSLNQEQFTISQLDLLGLHPKICRGGETFVKFVNVKTKNPIIHENMEPHWLTDYIKVSHIR